MQQVKSQSSTTEDCLKRTVSDHSIAGGWSKDVKSSPFFQSSMYCSSYWEVKQDLSCREHNGEVPGLRHLEAAPASSERMNQRLRGSSGGHEVPYNSLLAFAHSQAQIHFNTSTQNGELCRSRLISRHFLTKGVLLSCSIELTQTSDSWHNTPLPFADPLWVPWHPRGKATSRSRRKAVRIQEANQRKGKQIRKGRSLAASCTSIHPNPRIYYCIPSTLRNFGNQSRLLVALQRSACPRQPFCQLNS